MVDSVVIEVGSRSLYISTAHLPPVGTRIDVHKHLTSDGSVMQVEVISHEWRLEEGPPDEVPRELAHPLLMVRIKTKVVDQAVGEGG